MRSLTDLRRILLLGVGLLLAFSAQARAADLHQADEVFGAFMRSLEPHHLMQQYRVTDEREAIRIAWKQAKQQAGEAELQVDGASVVVTLRRGPDTVATVAFDGERGVGSFKTDAIEATYAKDPISGNERVDVSRRGEDSVFRTESRIEAQEVEVVGEKIKELHPTRTALRRLFGKGPAVKVDIGGARPKLRPGDRIELTLKSATQREELMSSVLPVGSRPEPKVVYHHEELKAKAPRWSEWRQLSRVGYDAVLASKILARRKPGGSASGPSSNGPHAHR
jgi:hypothetical protein